MENAESKGPLDLKVYKAFQEHQEKKEEMERLDQKVKLGSAENVESKAQQGLQGL